MRGQFPDLTGMDRGAERQTERALPAKCARCNRPLQTPVFCDACQAFQDPGAVGDHFDLFALPRRYDVDLDTLHRRYIALSRHAHPDRHVGDSPEVQSLAMAVSAAVNQAYRTLSDPIRRAGYLLGLLGGPASADDKSVPDGFLETIMMMQEELQDARAAGDAEARARLEEVLRTQEEGLTRRLEGLFAQLDEAVACEATRQDLLHQIRRQLNAIAYVRKLLGQV